jgi:hypothetical protein
VHEERRSRRYITFTMNNLRFESKKHILSTKHIKEK